MNDENLRPCEYELTQEEAKKGGINSGKARRRKKRLREIAQMIGEALVKSDAKKDALKDFADIADDELTHDVAVIVRHYQEAESGNVQSARYLAQLRGELVDKAEVEAVVDTRQKEIEEAALKFFNRTE